MADNVNGQSGSRAADSAPPLRQVLEGAIARIQVNQLFTVADSQGSSNVWHVEVPIRHHETNSQIEIELRQESKNTDNDGRDNTWSVQLSFYPEHLGRIDAKIVLRAGQVSTWV